jgi:Uma2 family endonuclease
MGLVKQLAKPRSYSIAEYIRLEQQTDEKHEYVDGQIVAMAGGTLRSALVAANLTAALHRALDGSPCRVYTSDARIRAGRTPFLTYPDISVICGLVGTDTDDPTDTTATNPRVLIEILSPSTEMYDRGEKFSRYRRISSLEEYVLVAQDKPTIETFHKNKAGEWVLDEAMGLKSTLKLKSLKIKLKLEDIYSGVKLDDSTTGNAD